MQAVAGVGPNERPPKMNDLLGRMNDLLGFWYPEILEY